MTSPTHGSAPASAPVPLSGHLFHTDPAALYRQMRQEHGAVVPIVLTGDIPGWLVIGYREFHHVTSDPVLFTRDSSLWNQWHRIPDDWPLLTLLGRGPSIIYTVGERHRLRVGMMNDALETVDPFELRSQVEKFADRLIDALCAKGEADLVADYAMLLPAFVLLDLFGLPEEEAPALIPALSAIFDGQEGALGGLAHLRDSMTRLVAERRKHPSDDMASQMLTNTSGFTEEEIIEDLMVVVFAAHQGVADWICNSLRLVLTDERFAASLFGGRNSIAEAMNEVMWEDAPTQNVPGRWVSRDTRLGDQNLRAGDLVLLGIQGANSDPHVRTDRSALTGGNNAHFGFTHGEHRCPFPAQEIAEVMARTAIEIILDRLPDIDLAVPAETLMRRPSPWIRGLVELPVRFTPTAALGRPSA